MKTFRDCKVGDKLYFVNDDCTFDIYEIEYFKLIGSFVLICTSIEKFTLSSNRTHEQVGNLIICSNAFTAKSFLEAFKINADVSLKKLENENI